MPSHIKPASRSAPSSNPGAAPPGSSPGSGASGSATASSRADIAARMVPEPPPFMPAAPVAPAPAHRPAPGRKGEPPHASASPAGLKHFVIDTNVLLHAPDALFVFQEHHVVIPFTVIEELDTFKRDEGERGRNARECIRHLDRLRQLGRLTDGVRWGQAEDLSAVAARTAKDDAATGSVRIDITEHPRPAMLSEDKPDNRIISTAWDLQQRGVNVTFVSKDLNARIKADALGLRTEDFENQKVDAGKLYRGFTTLDVPGALIDNLYRDRMLPLDKLAEASKGVFGEVPAAHGRSNGRTLYANQFVQLRDEGDENHVGLARRLADTDHLIPITGPRKPVFGIMARNVQQTMALDLLMDDEIRMITLLGSAGTGKTLLAVAAGMAKVFTEERYDKLLVARPIMPMGRDIGYLPGSKDDKLGAWMQPIFDNLGYLLSTRGATIGTHGHGQHAESHSTEQRIQRLVNDGKLVLEPLTYIRGRSIPHQFMIVDEAQNLTPHEVKTIISRIGDGTKVVLTGDIGQIDNPYLDEESNGLSYAIEKMKGLRIVGHVSLAKSERSELASLAASLL